MAGLTKQHFKGFAKIIGKNMRQYDHKGVSFSYLDKNLIADMISFLKSQNALFDENQFRKACLENE